MMVKTAASLMVMGAALIAATASAVPPPVDYTGYGTEPFWDLRIAGGRMTYSASDEPVVAVALPRAVPIRLGRRYATARMTVEITREGRCNDGMGDTYWSDTVRVWLGRRVGRPFEGCGGTRASPPSLANSRWKIVEINGRTVSGDNYFFDFEEQRLTGQAGCNHFSGPYSETRPTLRPGAIVSTRMACPGQRMLDEREVMRILSGPLSMAFPVGNILRLAGSGGTLRLVSEE